MFQTYTSPLFAPLPTIDLDNPRYKHLPKHLYKTELRSTRSNPTLNEHHTSVQILLKQEDMRGTPGYGLGQKFRNLKYSSQSMLSKKMTALKAKLGDTGIGEEIDQEIVSTPVKKRNKTFKRTVSDSSVMAEVLARSVLHAHNSLSCILEAQDSASSQYDDEETITESGVLNNQEIESVLGKTVSEPLLIVQETLIDTHSSIVSSSSSASLSSDDDEYNSDSKEINYETVSNIVKNVELLEKTTNSQNYMKQMSLPSLAFENKESNPFVFPNIVQEEKVSEEHPENYLEDLQAPIAKIETDEESDELATTESKSKSILPHVYMADDIRKKGLFNTAMQTILLDKVHIMGTYTPPMSPLSLTTKSSIFSVDSLNSEQLNKLQRSTTAISLDDCLHKCEHSASMYNIRRQSNPCLLESSKCSCFSDSALDKAVTKPLLARRDETEQSRGSVYRNKMSFISLLSHSDDNKLKRVNSSEQLVKKRFNLLHLTRRKSHDPETNLKKVKSDDLHKKRFSFLHRTRTSSESDKNTKGLIPKILHKEKTDDPVKKHGLLGTALGNVVMETVQDILATSRVDKTAEENKFPVFPSSSILTGTNDNNPNESDTASLINTEIDRGTSVSDNNMHASLTPSLRNNSSPVPEHLPEQGHHRAESVGTKMVQSPAKLNSVPCIYRRSSDSDLSITPKGKLRFFYLNSNRY